jgi:hypothetical protein
MSCAPGALGSLYASDHCINCDITIHLNDLLLPEAIDGTFLFTLGISMTSFKKVK